MRGAFLSGSWGSAFTSILTTAAACGGVGGAVDFWIQRRGQQRVRDWLETWWLRLSYVRWGNFGREEALFAVQVMDRLFGRHLFSARRMTVVVAVTFILAGLLLALIAIDGFALFPWHDSFFNSSDFTWFVATLFSLTASFSLTRFAANAAGSIITKVPFLNCICSVFILLFQYLLFCYTISVTKITDLLIYVLWDNSDFSIRHVVALSREVLVFVIVTLHNVNPFPTAQLQRVSSILTVNEVDVEPLPFMWHLSDLTALIPNFIRLLIAAIFLGSYLLQTLQRPIMELWARIVESDTPVFTLLFGGLGGLAKAIQEIAKIV
jgi:hypothetical protein